MGEPGLDGGPQGPIGQLRGKVTVETEPDVSPNIGPRNGTGNAEKPTIANDAGQLMEKQIGRVLEGDPEFAELLPTTRGMVELDVPRHLACAAVGKCSAAK